MKETQRESQVAARLVSTLRNELGSFAVLETPVSGVSEDTEDTMLLTSAIPWLLAGNPAWEEAFLSLPRPAVLPLTLLHAVSLKAHFSAHCATLYYNELGTH